MKSFVDLVKGIGSEIKVVALKIEHGFVLIFGKDAADKFGKAALDLLKSDLGQIVIAEVETLAGVSTLSGVEKAAQAQSAVLGKAKGLGIDASKSIVNMLIELAVQFIGGNLTAVTSAVKGS